MIKEVKPLSFTLHKRQEIQINGGTRECIKGIEDILTEYASNYIYTPAFKKGLWDGKISLFNRAYRSFPYGLFLKVLRFVKKEFPEIPYSIDPQIGHLFSGVALTDISYNLTLQPYGYQKQCIEASLKASKGINVVATAGGKSLIIAYIIDIINNNINNNKSLIVVPTIALVNQFKGDLIEYGMDGGIMGMVNSKTKEFDKDIVISTWQSLQNNTHMLPDFNTVIIDECIDGDTLITTPSGQVKISDISIGHEIISYDITNNEFEIDVVEKVFENNMDTIKDDMFELVFDTGDILKVTGNHKILTTNGYIKTKDLKINDDIISHSI